jgi:hypothetical protein
LPMIGKRVLRRVDRAQLVHDVRRHPRSLSDLISYWSVPAGATPRLVFQFQQSLLSRFKSTPPPFLQILEDRFWATAFNIVGSGDTSIQRWRFMRHSSSSFQRVPGALRLKRSRDNFPQTAVVPCRSDAQSTLNKARASWLWRD